MSQTVCCWEKSTRIYKSFLSYVHPSGHHEGNWEGLSPESTYSLAVVCSIEAGNCYTFELGGSCLHLQITSDRINCKHSFFPEGLRNVMKLSCPRDRTQSL